MRKWIGVQDHISDVGGEALKTAESVSFRINGELRRRQGLTRVDTEGGIHIGHIRSPVAGSSLVVVQSDGTVEGLAL